MIKPWLWIPPKLAHDIGPIALKAISPFFAKPTPQWSPFEWRGLSFQNRLGIAGGVDKNGESISSWWKLGAGFVEVGTVTPKAQTPNPGIIIDRQPDRSAVWNKMGFPNGGVNELKKNLQKLKRPYSTPLFINIGKNRDTENERASEDYVFCINELNPWADGFVVNISSPNTKNLRELQQSSHLKKLLADVMTANTNNKPVLLKISPDISTQEMQQIIEVSCNTNISGWIISNTTRDRDAGLKFSVDGGVSGEPLRLKSRSLLKKFVEELGDHRQDRLIVSVGGVMDHEEVKKRLDIGADLVQCYAALIFSGPLFFHSVAKHTKKLD